jgi:LCP family protein required for cell wall assembly
MPEQRVTRVIATVTAVLVVLVTGVAWSKVRSFEDGIYHVFAPSLGHGGNDGALDILLVGMDSRTDAHGNPLSPQELASLRAGDEVASNTDTIILIRIPDNGKSATAISIPRDTYVSAPGMGKTKINGVYGQTKEEKRVSLVESGAAPDEAEREGTEAGREALIKTVADLTGVTVDHYAEIGLLGFSLITDALGGVNVCLKEPVFEPMSGADFPAGPQKLNGPQALSFVRQRHELPRGDLDRVVRQQVVMSSLAHQVISGKTLSSPATLNRLQSAIQRSVVLSSGWDIMDFVNQLQKLAAGRIAFATIPVLDESGLGRRIAGGPGQGQDRGAHLRARQDERQRPERHRYQRARLVGVTGVERQRVRHRQGRQQRHRACEEQSGTGQQRRRSGRTGRRERTGRAARRRELVGTEGVGPGGAQQRLHRPGFGHQRRRPEAGGRLAPRHWLRHSPALADPHRRQRPPGVRQLI